MQLTGKDLLASIGVLLALLGLVWQAAIQFTVNDAQTARLDKIERIQTEDHDALVRMKEGIDFLVRTTKEREQS